MVSHNEILTIQCIFKLDILALDAEGRHKRLFLQIRHISSWHQYQVQGMPTQFKHSNIKILIKIVTNDIHMNYQTIFS